MCVIRVAQNRSSSLANEFQFFQWVEPKSQSVILKWLRL